MQNKIYHNTIKFKDIDTYFYQKLVKSSKRATPFHTLDFLQLIATSFTNTQLKFTVIYEGETIIAIMPYFLKKGNPFRMKSSILGCYGGFIYLEKDRNTILKYLSQTNVNQPFSSVISFNDDLLTLTKKWHVDEEATWIMNTEGTYEELYKSIHYKTRNQIQKSVKSNVKVASISTESELVQVKQLYKNLVQKHNIKKPFSDLFFDTAFKMNLTSKGLLFKVAKTDETIISFSFFVSNETEMFYWINASAPEYLNLNGTNALLNDAIKICANSNIKTLNFGGVPASNKGLLHFKKRWNTYEHKYTNYTNNFYYKLKHLI